MSHCLKYLRDNKFNSYWCNLKCLSKTRCLSCLKFFEKMVSNVSALRCFARLNLFINEQFKMSQLIHLKDCIASNLKCLNVTNLKCRKNCLARLNLCISKHSIFYVSLSQLPPEYWRWRVILWQSFLRHRKQRTENELVFSLRVRILRIWFTKVLIL